MVRLWHHLPALPLAQWVGTLVLLAAVVLALRVWRGGGQRAIVVLFAWLAVPSVGLLLASVFKPLYLPRYVVFSAPAAALLAAVVIAQFPVRWARLLVLELVVVAMLPSWAAAREPDAKASPASVVAELDRLARPGDAVYIVGKDLGGLKWACPEAFDELKIVGQADAGWRASTLYQPSVKPIDIEAQLGDVRRLWVFADRGALGATLTDFGRLGFTEVDRVQGTDEYRTLLVLLRRK